MKMMKKAARGFTLIELMIVVAIIGILAAIAIPNFLKYQLRTRRTEGSVNVAAIRTAQIAYYGNRDAFVDADPNPGTVPAGQKAGWDRTQDEWKQLGFEPEGDVYYQYVVAADKASFVVGATADLDRNEDFSCWVYAKPKVVGTTESLEDAATMPDVAICPAGKEPDPADPAGPMIDMVIGRHYNKVVLFSGEERF